MLSNCDTLFEIDYLKFYNYHEINKNYFSCSKVQLNFLMDLTGQNISIEKPKLNFIANAGLYVMKEIINLVKKKFDLTDLINKC